MPTNIYDDKISKNYQLNYKDLSNAQTLESIEQKLSTLVQKSTLDEQNITPVILYVYYFMYFLQLIRISPLKQDCAPPDGISIKYLQDAELDEMLPVNGDQYGSVNIENLLNRIRVKSNNVPAVKRVKSIFDIYYVNLPVDSNKK